jgi:hypothetical protein
MGVAVRIAPVAAHGRGPSVDVVPEQELVLGLAQRWPMVASMEYEAGNPPMRRLAHQPQALAVCCSLRREGQGRPWHQEANVQVASDLAV